MLMTFLFSNVKFNKSFTQFNIFYNTSNETFQFKHVEKLMRQIQPSFNYGNLSFFTRITCSYFVHLRPLTLRIQRLTIRITLPECTHAMVYVCINTAAESAIIFRKTTGMYGRYIQRDSTLARYSDR